MAPSTEKADAIPVHLASMSPTQGVSTDSSNAVASDGPGASTDGCSAPVDPRTESPVVVEDKAGFLDQGLGQPVESARTEQSVDQDQSQINGQRTEAATQKPAGVSSDLFLEIHALQERLLLLEEQATKDLNVDPQDLGADGHIEAPDASEEEKKLRKQIRRAHFARKWVGKTETHAEETTDDRSHLGGPKGPRISAVARELGLRRIRGSGIVDYKTDREYNLRCEMWDQEYNSPAAGVRFPTSLRPVYSTKLGPPTQWDTSDSEEWSSDGSTRSRDFDYFRARLRGDFEWELDRLNAQRQRYLKHKEKKKAEEARKFQEQLEKEEQEVKERQAREAQELAPSQDEKSDADAPSGAEILSSEVVVEPSQPLKPPERHALPKLNRVEWEVFRVIRNTPTASSFAIDILIGEPQISNDNSWGYFGGYGSRPINRAGMRARASPKAKGLDAKSVQVSTKQLPAHSAHSDGQGPLPERIRIHSKQLLKILAFTHRSELISVDDEDATNPSLVMLRPFRMLRYYDKEIRDWHKKLVTDLRAPKAIQGKVTRTSENKTAPGAADNAASERDHTETAPSDAGSEHEEEPKVKDPKGYSTSEAALEHITCLLEFMDTYISRKLAYLNSAACENVSFSDIWHLFKPGEVVISSDGKQAYRVVNLKSERHRATEQLPLFYAKQRDELARSSETAPITINCVYIHFDGKKLGPVTETFNIKRFDGERPVSALEIYPLRFHILKERAANPLKAKLDGSDLQKAMEEGVTQLRKSLIERGKKFVDVAAVKHMYYAGLTLDTRDEVESQVVIDFEEAFAAENNTSWRPRITQLVGSNVPPPPSPSRSRSRDGNKSCDAGCCWGENVHDDSYVENKSHQDFINGLMAEIEDSRHKLPSAALYPRSLDDIKTEENELKEEELLIMSYRVFGFVLRDRTWAQLDLTHLTYVDDSGSGGDINEDDDPDEDDKTAFGRLVLPTGHKKMVLSLIAQHFRNKGSQKDKDEQLDIVRGKGKGLIILLHGAPGVGKTTTAEGVAEKFQKPLFQITCGDLGASAKEVETALQTNFALANRWGCILLLDEADVFLAERRREDFNRNGLVAVFLRVLEYYAGILFLTTNRIGDFDEAFASRIHMSLHYPPLDEVSTLKVFKLNLDMITERYKEKGRKIKIDVTEINHYVGEYFRENTKARWNGRQIRNACQTALALAEFDAQPQGRKYDLNATSDAKVHLKVSNLEIVSNAYLEFIQYLKEVHGADSETHAKESGLRALETVIAAIKAGKDIRGKSVDKDGGKGENPLRAFKLKSVAPTPTNTAPPPEQPYHTYQHPREAPRQPAQSSAYGQGPAVTNPAQDRRLAPPAQGHHQYTPDPSYLQPSYGPQGHVQNPLGQQQPHPPQQGPYGPSNTAVGSGYAPTGSGYPVAGDARGAPLHEQPHPNQPWPGTYPGVGGDPGQQNDPNRTAGQAHDQDYDSRYPASGANYPPSGPNLPRG